MVPADMGMLGRGQDETNEHLGQARTAVGMLGRNTDMAPEDAQDKTSWNRPKDTQDRPQRLKSLGQLCRCPRQAKQLG